MDPTAEKLSQNRAEELGFDVWEEFVLPPYFDELDLLTASKPRVIVAGRGCGKTMLLRYLSHGTMFSPKRPVGDNWTKRVGLYWRADTQFVNTMTGRGIEDDVWAEAFRHLVALAISQEVMSSVRSMARCSWTPVTSRDEENLEFRRLQAFDGGMPTKFSELYDWLERQTWVFQSWVSNVRTQPRPTFLPAHNFVGALIHELQAQVVPLKDVVFLAFIDEYENHLPYQRRLINDWLKHSQAPLIFHVAVKRNSFDLRETSGSEQLSEIHDFRIHDLESLLQASKDADIFFAEILRLRLQLSSDIAPIESLRDLSSIPSRKSPKYKTRIRAWGQSYLPGRSFSQHAQAVLDDSRLRSRLEHQIGAALQTRHSRLQAGTLLLPKYPEASIVVPALLHRERLPVEQVIDELTKLARGELNRFTGPTNWIHNNLVGCLLLLYAPFGAAPPLYSGFSTYCDLANGNIRFFIELCHKAYRRVHRRTGVTPTVVSIQDQAEAAREASTEFLGEVRSYGKHGNQLHTLLLRLGTLFELSQRRPSQSEPERTHFAVTRGRVPLNEQTELLLKEAVKWSVLAIDPETKIKDQDLQVRGEEYVVNPIYAPYLRISYRKRRKLEIPAEDLNTLTTATLEGFRALLTRYSRSWKVDAEAVVPTLFDSSQ